MTADVELPPIEHDEDMNRTYIPLPGGWEVQTRGEGSTFRICEPGDDPMRLAVPASPYLHDTLARMARDIHAAVSHATAAKDAEIERLQSAYEAMTRQAQHHMEAQDKAEAEAEALRRDRDDCLAAREHYASLYGEQHGCAEQLAEALRETTAALERHFDGTCDGTEVRVALNARALLRDQENNDE